MTIAVAPPAKHSAYPSGAFALLLAVGAILGALALEHIGGVKPCHLCLEQRFAYYAGAPALFAALVLLSAGQRHAAALLFGLTTLAFVLNAGLGAYHAGVEWHFWPGPSSCTGAETLTTSAGDLLGKLATTHVVRCDEASFRVFGVSLAGWNVAASLLIAALSARAASRSTRV